VGQVAERVGESLLAEALRQCERAMTTCFSRSTYGGADVLIRSDLRGCAVLEVNAFGDLLPGVAWRGMDTYEAQIEQVVTRGRPAAAKEVA
jgi:hypothetical protein